ncbi:MAG: hypothetical protein WC797_03925 [Candidatus Paceibacterota bacterium]
MSLLSRRKRFLAPCKSKLIRPKLSERLFALAEAFRQVKSEGIARALWHDYAQICAEMRERRMAGTVSTKISGLYKDLKRAFTDCLFIREARYE